MENIYYKYIQNENHEYEFIGYNDYDMIFENLDYVPIIPKTFTLRGNSFFKDGYKLVDEDGDIVLELYEHKNLDILYGFMEHITSVGSKKSLMVFCRHHGFESTISFEIITNPMDNLIQELIITNDLFKL